MEKYLLISDTGPNRILSLYHPFICFFRKRNNNTKIVFVGNKRFKVAPLLAAPDLLFWRLRHPARKNGFFKIKFPNQLSLGLS